MISIHLRRTGAKKDAHYRVVVTDSRAARDGAFIEVLGHYHPRYQPAKVVLDVHKIKAWIDKGAQPSDTVRSLLKKVESGVVETEHAVAPSRHRDTVKHAETRATAPEPEPEVEVAAVDEDAGEKAEAVPDEPADEAVADEAEVETVAEDSSDGAEVEAVAEDSSDGAEVEAVAEESSDGAEVEAVAEGSSDDAEVDAVAEKSPDDAAAASEGGDDEATAEEGDEQDKE